MWDHVTVVNKVDPKRVTIVSQSLGTGVASGLTARLAGEGTSNCATSTIPSQRLTIPHYATDLSPSGLVLVAPFRGIGPLLETYRLGNFIPILSPLASVPFLLKGFLNLLYTKFDTQSIIQVSFHSSSRFVP